MASWVAWSTASERVKGLLSDSRCVQSFRLYVSEEEGGRTVQSLGHGEFV